MQCNDEQYLLKTLCISYAPDTTLFAPSNRCGEGGFERRPRQLLAAAPGSDERVCKLVLQFTTCMGRAVQLLINAQLRTTQVRTARAPSIQLPSSTQNIMQPQAAQYAHINSSAWCINTPRRYACVPCARVSRQHTSRRTRPAVDLPHHLLAQCISHTYSHHDLNSAHSAG
jgi:hypothetical protein